MMSMDATPECTPRRFTAGTIVYCAFLASFSALAWLAVTFQMAFFIPRTEKVFNDFKMRTPWLTELVLLQSWWIVPTLVLVGLLFCLGVRRRWAWSFLLVVLPLIISVVMLVGMYIPTTELIIGLQQGELKRQ